MQIKVLYQRDYLHLLVKYGLEPPSQLAAQTEGTPPLWLDETGAEPPPAEAQPGQRPKSA